MPRISKSRKAPTGPPLPAVALTFSSFGRIHEAVFRACREAIYDRHGQITVGQPLLMLHRRAGRTPQGHQMD